MLMILPLFFPTEIDYSKAYGLRGLFQMGASICNDFIPEPLLIPPPNANERAYVSNP